MTNLARAIGLLGLGCFTALGQLADAQQFSGTLELSNADIEFLGDQINSNVGFSVSSAGDFNGDGFDDVFIGAPFDDIQLGAPTGQNTGSGYLLFGGPDDSPSNRLIRPPAADVRFTGINDFDTNGFKVSTAGDVNGDGLDDLLIGTWPPATGTNLVYLIYGRTDYEPGPLRVSLSEADAVFEVPSVEPVSVLDFRGFGMSSAGDFDSDGIDDFMIGAMWIDAEGRFDAGETYLFYGSQTDPLVGEVSLAQADVTFAGIKGGGHAGWSVSKAGDVDGDGHDDVLIGAPYASGVGETYLIYGQDASNRIEGRFDLSAADATFQGLEAGDLSGFDVSGGGDINGDGLDDLLISAYNADPDGKMTAGEVYLVYGREGQNKLSGIFDLADADITFLGANINDAAGRSVALVEDMNGDGLADVVIGAHTADPPGRTGAGVVYLIYGREGEATLEGRFDLAESDAIFWGSSNGENAGWSLSSAGDMNGDGLTDLVIGAWNKRGTRNFGRERQNGASYIVYGRVPEPSTGMLLVASLALASVVRNPWNGNS